MASGIRVAILDSHPANLEKYVQCLKGASQIEVVGTALTATDFERIIDSEPVDVALVDALVPIAADNPHPYQILQHIPKLLRTKTGLSILVVAMVLDRVLIQSVLDVGASGYLLKDDRVAFAKLGSIVKSIAEGGIFMSLQATQLLQDSFTEKLTPRLSPLQCEVLALADAHPGWGRRDLANYLNLVPAAVQAELTAACLQLEAQDLPTALSKAHQLGWLG